MGIYVFSTDVMYELLFKDAARKDASSNHDFGKDIIPVDAGGLARLRLPVSGTRTASRRRTGRDVGTLDAYYQASMDLIQVDPILNLLRPRLADPHATSRPMPPPKFVHTDPDRRGARLQLDRLPGLDRLGRPVYRSIISPGVRIHSYALVDDSILFDGVEVGRHARVRRAIIDKDVKVPPRLRRRLEPRSRPRPGADHHRGRHHGRGQERGPGEVHDRGGVEGGKVVAWLGGPTSAW